MKLALKPDGQLALPRATKLVRHTKDERPASIQETHRHVAEAFFLLERHVTTCGMCTRAVQQYEMYDRDIRWCATYRRMHHEIWHLIGICRS